MSFSYKELIKQRKSVRTFDGTGLKMPENVHYVVSFERD